MLAQFPSKRHRRMRTTENLRDLVAETSLQPKDLILPLFVTNDQSSSEVKGACGIARYSQHDIIKIIDKAVTRGIKSVMLFPVIDNDKKDINGSLAFDENGLIPQTLKKIKSEKFPITTCVDIALDPYTSNGHDGIIRDTDNGPQIDNDKTLEALGQMSLVLATAGADAVCPSDMMDGRVAYIRHILEQNWFDSTLIISYAAKFASCFYGPFRQVVGAQPLTALKDKKTYQMDPRNGNEALSEILLDQQEGADVIIVKPGLPYLDIISNASSKVNSPIWAYHVSGEYAMIKAAAAQGYIDEKDAFIETAIAFKRAGARGIITYAAIELAEWCV